MPTPQMLEQAAAARAAYEAAQARRQTAAARAERARSRSAYRGLGRDDALALAKAKLDEVFETRAFEQWRPPAGMHVKRYAGEWGAVLEGDGEEPLFVESMGAPLTSELGSGEREPVDLSLEPAGVDAFAPRNPNVPTRIGRDGTASFAGSQTAIRVEGAAPAAPVETNGRLFYANGLRDTDVAIAPTPGGASFDFAVRSADAPEQAVLDFDLPPGVRMRMAGSAPGLVELVRGTEVVGHVNPPAAWDADGEPVTVGYRIDGDRLLVDYPHRQKDLAYPLYVDPDYEDWGWGVFDWSGWAFEEGGSTAFSGGNVSGYLRVSNAVGTFNNGSFGAYRFANPRGYIKQLEGGWVSIYHAFTCDNLGILVPDRSTWKARYTGTNCAAVVTNAMPVVTNGPPTVPSTDTRYGDHAMMQHWMNTTGQRKWVGYIQMYSVQLTYADNELPTVTSVANSTNGAWKKAGDSVTITPTGIDQGMGLFSFNLYPPQVAPKAWLAGCDGTHQGGRCPNTSVSGPITYTIPSNSDEGALSVGVQAMDLLGKRRDLFTTVKVDRSSPTTTGVSGALYTAANKLVVGPTALTLRPQDSRSGVKSVDVYLDRGSTPPPVYSWSHSTCSASVQCPTAPTPTDYSFDPASFGDGVHAIEVEAKDAVSNTPAKSTWQVLTDSTPPSQPNLTHTDQPAAGTWWQATASVTASSSDRGTAAAGDWGSGIERLELLDGDDVIATKSYTCTDTIGGRCHESESHTFTYSGAGEPPAGAVQLAEGVRTLSVRAVDKAGRVSSRSAPWQVKVDESAPTLTLSHTTPPTEDWLESYSNTLTVSAEDGGSGVAELEVQVGDSADPLTFSDPCRDAGSDQCPASLAHDFALSDLPEGVTEVRVVARDGAGKESPAETFTVKVDKGPPAVGDLEARGFSDDWSLHGEGSFDLSLTDGGGIESAVLLIDGSASSPGAGPITVDCFDAACSEAIAAAAIRSDQLPLGSHVARFEIRDHAGKELLTPEEGITFTVDQRPYNVALPKIAGVSREGQTLTATDGEWRPPEPISTTYQWQRCSWDEEECLDVAGETDSSYVIGAADLGQRIRVVVEATNVAGSETAMSFARYVPTELGPELSIDPQSPATTQDWIGPQAWPVLVTAVDRSAETGSGVTSVTLRLDDESVPPETTCEISTPEDSCPESTMFPLNLVDATEGPHELSAEATNTQGEMSSSSRVVQLDKTAPTLDLDGALTMAADGELSEGSYDLAINAADGDTGLGPQSGVGQVAVLVDGETVAEFPQGCELGNCPLVRTFTYDTARYGPGHHSVKVSAWDLVGNERSASLEVGTGCDAAPPEVTSVADPIGIEDAQQVIEANHDGVVAESPAVESGGEMYAPTLVDAGVALDAAETRTRAEIPKEATGSAIIGNGVTAACLTPTTTTTAATGAAVVNEDSALYANTAQGTDTVVRPIVDGVETFTSIRDDSAPEDQSWTLAAGDAQLNETGDGGVELVDSTPPAFDLPGEGMPLTTEAELATAKDEGVAPADAALTDLAADAAAQDAPEEAGIASDAGSEAISEAEITNPGVAPEGEEEAPQGDEPTTPLDVALGDELTDVEVELETTAEDQLQQASQQGAAEVADLNTAATASQQAALPPLVLADVAAPVSRDANQEAVPTTLDADGQTLTMHVDHQGAAVDYPIAADPWVKESQTEPRVGYRPVYSTELRVTGWRNTWKPVGEWWCAYWIETLGGTPLGNNLYAVTVNGKTYRLAKKQWCAIDVLVKEPILQAVKVLSYWQRYEYWVNVDVEVWQKDDDETVAGAAVKRNVPLAGDIYERSEFNEPRDCRSGEPDVDNDGLCGNGDIHTHLATLIAKTPGDENHAPGTPCNSYPDTIEIAVHSELTDNGVEAELKRAIKRCVKVKLLQNSKSDPLEGGEGSLRELLGDNYVRCGQPAKKKYACVSRVTGGVMHAKYALFSRFRPEPGVTRHNLVWIASANLSIDDKDRFNNSVTLYNDGPFYTKMKDNIWKPMFANGDRGAYPDGKGKVNVVGPDIGVQASPLAGDPVADRLNAIRPKDCVIKMVQADFGYRREVALALDRLVGKDRCRFYGVIGKGAIGGQLKETLADKPRSTRSLWEARKVHDKIVTARWRGAGGDMNYLVITGSQNMTTAALKAYDEVQMYLHHQAIYENFDFHFRRAKMLKGVCFNLTPNECPRAGEFG